MTTTMTQNDDDDERTISHNKLTERNFQTENCNSTMEYNDENTAYRVLI